MKKFHTVDVLGFYLDTQFVPVGIDIVGGISVDLPSDSLGQGMSWRWSGDQWLQAETPPYVQAVEHKTYTQAEWIRKNGLTGYKILSATKSDPLAQYFHEVLKAEDIVSTADKRLEIAYGYYVGAGYISQEEADSVCGFPVDPLTAEQVQERMEGVDT